MSTTVVVGRLGKPHGVRGEISVEVRTDEPDLRFADGAVLGTETARGDHPGPDLPTSLTVASSRWHQSRLLVVFEEITGRDDAEAVRGLLLARTVERDETPADPDEFYDHQLVGLPVVTTDGRPVGELAAVVHGPAQDLLAVRTDGAEVLVPFVTELVPTVDVPGGRIVVVDRPGLLEPDDGA